MSNAQKTPLSRTLPTFVAAAALDQIRRRGVPLPGSVMAVNGPIVTVQFNVTDKALSQVPVQMPVFGPEYVRYPIQNGDKGVAWAVPTYIGSVTGLGNNLPADLDGPSVGALQMVWFPVGNKNWSTSGINPNVLTLYGPQGVTIQDQAGNSICTVTPSAITVNGKTQVLLQVGGSLKLKVTAAGVFIDGQVTDFLQHFHSGVQTGTGVSGVVASP